MLDHTARVEPKVFQGAPRSDTIGMAQLLEDSLPKSRHIKTPIIKRESIYSFSKEQLADLLTRPRILDYLDRCEGLYELLVEEWNALARPESFNNKTSFSP